MAQQPLELILLRQLASHLVIPMWMMDEQGNLIYYNASAEGLLGVHFDDVGPINSEQLVGKWQVTQMDAVSIVNREPVHDRRYAGLPRPPIGRVRGRWAHAMS